MERAVELLRDRVASLRHLHHTSTSIAASVSHSIQANVVQLYCFEQAIHQLRSTERARSQREAVLLDSMHTQTQQIDMNWFHEISRSLMVLLVASYQPTILFACKSTNDSLNPFKSICLEYIAFHMHLNNILSVDNIQSRMGLINSYSSSQAFLCELYQTLVDYSKSQFEQRLALALPSGSQSETPISTTSAITLQEDKQTTMPYSFAMEYLKNDRKLLRHLPSQLLNQRPPAATLQPIKKSDNRMVVNRLHTLELSQDVSITGDSKQQLQSEKLSQQQTVNPPTISQKTIVTLSKQKRSITADVPSEDKKIVLGLSLFYSPSTRKAFNSYELRVVSYPRIESSDLTSAITSAHANSLLVKRNYLRSLKEAMDDNIDILYVKRSEQALANHIKVLLSRNAVIAKTIEAYRVEAQKKLDRYNERVGTQPDLAAKKSVAYSGVSKVAGATPTTANVLAYCPPNLFTKKSAGRTTAASLDAKYTGDEHEPKKANQVDRVQVNRIDLTVGLSGMYINQKVNIAHSMRQAIDSLVKINPIVSRRIVQRSDLDSNITELSEIETDSSKSTAEIRRKSSIEGEPLFPSFPVSPVRRKPSVRAATSMANKNRQLGCLNNISDRNSFIGRMLESENQRNSEVGSQAEITLKEHTKPRGKTLASVLLPVMETEIRQSQLMSDQQNSPSTTTTTTRTIGVLKGFKQTSGLELQKLVKRYKTASIQCSSSLDVSNEDDFKNYCRARRSMESPLRKRNKEYHNTSVTIDASTTIIDKECSDADTQFKSDCKNQNLSLMDLIRVSYNRQSTRASSQMQKAQQHNMTVNNKLDERKRSNNESTLDSSLLTGYRMNSQEARASVIKKRTQQKEISEGKRVKGLIQQMIFLPLLDA